MVHSCSGHQIKQMNSLFKVLIYIHEYVAIYCFLLSSANLLLCGTGLPDLKSGRIPFLKILDAILGVQDAIFEFYGTTLGRVFFLQVLALFYLLNLFEEFKKKIGKV